MIINRILKAQDRGVPIIGIETADQCAVITRLSTSQYPAISWDVIKAFSWLNAAGQAVVAKLCGGDDPRIKYGNFADMLYDAKVLPPDTILVIPNAHLLLKEPGFTQGLLNLRDSYKAKNAIVVMLAPAFMLPDEITHDVIVYSEKLPDTEALSTLVTDLLSAAECTDADVPAITDILTGLSLFKAEQILATSLIKNGKVEVDMAALWEFKCQAISQVPGLSIWQGDETFSDIGGCENVKDYLLSIATGNNPVRSIIFIDEIEKSVSGTNDTSGVSSDMLGALLTFMENKKMPGILFIGHPGTAKSAISKAIGNEANIPCVCYDIGGMKDSLVGKSGQNIRRANEVIDAISNGKALFVATCNGLQNVPPELIRRFFLGTFFFDLPSEEDVQSIAKIYEQKYGISLAGVDMAGWTGAEIRAVADIAWRSGMPVTKAAKFVVPYATKSADKVEALRKSASGKYISAGQEGVYIYSPAPVANTSNERRIR